MGTFRDVIRAAKDQNLRTFKKLVNAQTWPAQQVDKIWLAAAKTLKKSFASESYALGTVSQEALAEGLIHFVKERQDTLVLTYLDDLEDINLQDKKGRTLLSYAVAQDKTKIIKAIQARQPDPTIVDESGCTALYYAMKASKVKLSKELAAHPVKMDNEEVARAYIEAAPSDVIKRTLVQQFIEQRTSSMSKDAFVEKWGAPQSEHEAMPWPTVRGTGERFMKGEMYNVGYFQSSEESREATDLDWEAIDAAKTLANKLSSILINNQCHGINNSEGSMTFLPFFMPTVGLFSSVEAFDAKMKKKSLNTGSGSYFKGIEEINQYYGGFDGLAISNMLENEEISQQQADGYNEMMALANEHLSDIKEYRLYPDLVEFPMIIGGLDRYYSFVGVIGVAVWT